MKEYDIYTIEVMTEVDAAALALEVLTIKGHTIYLVDFGGYFGYSCLVFLNGYHIYHANDYALHHNGYMMEEKTPGQLRELYLEKMNNIHFTPEEITAPLANYDEYSRREYYLRNYYGMQLDYISMFQILRTEQEEQEYKEKTEKMIFDPISFAYYNDSGFVEKHMELFRELEAIKNSMSDNFDYWKSAFEHEMNNCEYAISWQADYDTLSAFGAIKYHDDDETELEQYFDELHFTDIQRRAYFAARRDYLKKASEYVW